MRALAIFGLLAVSGYAAAQAPTCNLGCNPCAGVPSCLGPCPTALPVTHAAAAPCGVGGSFDLDGTEFDGSGTVPPLRLWSFDHYTSANSGCNDPAALGWLSHVGGSRWLLDQADWSAALGDGCISATPTPRRTVAELSFVDSPREGTVDHRAFYLVAAVDEQAGAYDFDRITGGDGCNDREVVVKPVPHPTFPLDPVKRCTNNASSIATTSVASNWPNDCDYMAIEVELPNDPLWYSEGGASATPALIQGLEILYQELPQGEEPRSSNACLGGWRPVRDPVQPQLALGAVPLGVRRTRVAIPNATFFSGLYWMAFRILYADSSLNPNGPYDLGSPPHLVSRVGGHCGPIAVAYTLDVPLYLELSDGLPASASVAPGDAITYTFVAGNLSDPTAGYDVILTDVFPPCLDVTGFDPIADPAQVSSPTMPLQVEWTAATRTLRLLFLDPLFPGEHRIEVSGLRAGTTGACVNEAYMESTRCRRELAYGADSTEIATTNSCPVLPTPVSGLTALRSGSAVALSWDTSPDAATDRYNVWQLEDRKELIPVANQNEWELSRYVMPMPVCRDVAKGSESCVDSRTLRAAVPRFYQVRGVCADGREGTAHP